ncbi:MAG: hypothetical protein H7A21_08720 [Spirochaetales bacterium]|nr:hypothetical protein [Leptospiraceae bacterium]MCP5481500.1 hypothetical protein [Spirochaetales bacterium]MCP5484329.1 hypothetical protein [Spirochaetales bacterium]
MLPPRPDFQRLPIVLLDGLWSLRLDARDRGLRDRWGAAPVLPYDGPIRVPFAIETEASGVALANPPEVFWYYREVDRPAEPGALLLHFGAVDQEACVFWNDLLLGRHVGGYSSFALVIDADRVLDRNRLVVRVRDSKRSRLPRGKQTNRKQPWAVFYRQCSGIWQSVWLESIPAAFIKSVRMQSVNDGFRVRIEPGGDEQCQAGARLLWKLYSGLRQDPTLESFPIYEHEVGHGEQQLAASQSGQEFHIPLQKIRSWCPEDPHMYGLELGLTLAGGAHDSVFLNTGHRLLSIDPSRGRVLLNGRDLYQRLVLCQGYYERGAYSAPDEEHMRRDLDLASGAGFNGLRIHEKIEDPRFLYLCDRRGLVVWQEMPSPPIFSRLDPEPFFAEWKSVIERDRNHPSIICRVVFNESWGLLSVAWSRRAREQLRKAYEFTKNLDPDVLVVDNSGFDHVRTDLLDVHHYLQNQNKIQKLYRDLKEPAGLRSRWWHLLYMIFPTRIVKAPWLPGAEQNRAPVLISELGGFGFYGERGGQDLFLEVQQALLEIAKHEHIRGFCYTQLYDVYQEKNGLFDFAREARLDIERLRETVHLCGRPDAPGH